MSIKYNAVRIWAMFAAMFTSATPAMLTVSSQRSRRGATFIEYALLAGIALVLFFVFRTGLSGIFDTLLQSIRDALG